MTDGRPTPHRVTVEPLLSAREVATILGMSTRKVLTEFEEGRLPGFKINDTPNGRVRFRASELEAWIQTRRRGPNVVSIRRVSPIVDAQGRILDTDCNVVPGQGRES